jgi:hypothetical protein
MLFLIKDHFLLLLQGDKKEEIFDIRFIDLLFVDIQTIEKVLSYCKELALKTQCIFD